MKLVFRMSGVGFSLSVGNLVEIREYTADEFVLPEVDSSEDVLGHLTKSGLKIPIFDLASALRLKTHTGKGVFLVLCGEMGEWALLVDEVEGIFPGKEFAPQTVSGLIVDPVTSPYEYLDVWRERILVQCDVPRLESCMERVL